MTWDCPDGYADAILKAVANGPITINDDGNIAAFFGGFIPGSGAIPWPISFVPATGVLPYSGVYIPAGGYYGGYCGDEDTEADEYISPVVEPTMICPDCLGAGIYKGFMKVEDPCSKCNGIGKV